MDWDTLVDLATTDQGHITARAALGMSMLDILQDILTNNPCDQDRRGRCRAHDWMITDPPCPYARGRELLRRCKINNAMPDHDEFPLLAKPIPPTPPRLPPYPRKGFVHVEMVNDPEDEQQP